MELIVFQACPSALLENQVGQPGQSISSSLCWWIWLKLKIFNLWDTKIMYSMRQQNQMKKMCIVSTGLDMKNVYIEILAVIYCREGGGGGVGI